MFFECTAQESYSKFFVINQKDENIWEDPSNAGSRPQQATEVEAWKADDCPLMTASGSN
jgi:hypothetical protein